MQAIVLGKPALARGVTQFWAAMAQGVHPFPFRTRPLSPAAPMVLPLRGGGRVGRRPILQSPRLRTGAFFYTFAGRGDGMSSPAQTIRAGFRFRAGH